MPFCDSMRVFCLVDKYKNLKKNKILQIKKEKFFKKKNFAFLRF